MRPQRSSSQVRPRLTSWRLTVPAPGATNSDWRERDHCALIIDLREELRARDAGVGASLLDAGGGETDVVAVLQRLIEESLERLVAEDLPPGPVGERGGLRRSRFAAHLFRRRDRRPLVVGTDRAASRAEEAAGEPSEPNTDSPHLRSPAARTARPRRGAGGPSGRRRCGSRPSPGIPRGTDRSPA